MIEAYKGLVATVQGVITNDGWDLDGGEFDVEQIDNGVRVRLIERGQDGEPTGKVFATFRVAVTKEDADGQEKR